MINLKSTSKSFRVSAFKTISLFFVMLTGVGFTNAQTASSYNFSQSSGSYTAITGGTAYAAADNAVYGGTANLLPFSFSYLGTSYTSFRISTNGFITLGNATTPSTSNYTPLSGTAASLNNCISALGCDLNSTPRYEVLGTSPNRIAVIQWSGVYRYSPGPGSTENLSFQVRLYETSNKIEIVYSPTTVVASTAIVGQVGIKGASNADVNNVSFTNATLTGYTYSRSWDNLITASSNADAVVIGTGLAPASGTTLTWMPATCAQPTVTATSTSVTSTGFTVNWTNSATYASGYNVRWRKVDELPSVTSWATPTVVAAGSSSYAITGLSNSTSYIYSVEGLCSGSSRSNYSKVTTSNTTNGIGLVQTLAACPGAPTALTSSSIGTTTATISWTAASPAPGSGYEYYYNTTGTAPTGSTTPSGSTAAGIVTANLSSLTSATQYYYWVRSNCNGTDKSTWTGSGTFTTVCLPETAPTAVQTFATYTGAAPAPVCWSETKGTFGAFTGTVSDWLLKGSGFANVTSSNPGVGINLYGGSSGTPDNDWIISNQIDLGATPSLYRVSYKMAVTTYNATGSVTTLGTHTVKVVVSTDGGTTWTSANVIKTYTGAATYSTSGITETVDLTGYSGVVKIGFLATTIGTTPDIDFHIDDFKVELIPTCPNPTAAAATSVTSNSAIANWSGGTGSYIIEYGATGFTPGTGATAGGGTVVTASAGATNITLTGLSSSTTYQYYVRQVCSGPSYSTNSSAISFTTLCGASTAPTAVQTFATYTGYAPAPTCWSEATGTFGAVTTADASWLLKTSGFANASASNPGVGINLYGGSSGTPDNDWIISNPIDLGATAGLYRVSYKMAVTTYNATGTVSTLGTHTVKVVVSTDGGATWSNTNVIKTYTGAASYSNTGVTETIDLTTYSGVVKIGFLATTIGTTPDIDFHIDDFLVEAIPACAAPTSLSSSSVGNTTATISWGAVTGASSYDWEIRTTGACGSGSPVQSGNTATTSVNLTGLTAGQTYTYCVRTVCAGPTQSTYNSSAFTTTQPGTTCANPIVVNSYPYTLSSNSTGMGFDIGTQTSTCSSSYGGGEDVVFQLNITTTGTYSINLTNTSSSGWIGWFLKDNTNCATTSSSLGCAVSGSGNTANGTYTFTTAGTYYLIIDYFATPNNSAYTLNITPPCSGAPTGGTASTTTPSRCQSQTAVLTVSGQSSDAGITYQWQVSSTSGSGYANVSGGSGATTTSYTTAALTPGTYYYVCKTTCTGSGLSTLSAEDTIVVTATPTVSISPTTASVCGAASITLTASGASTYAWSNSGGSAAAATFSGLTGNTTYTVTGTTSGCTASTTRTVTFFPSTTGTLPQNVDFTSFAGGNLATLFTGWFEALGIPPSGTTSSWTSGTFANVSGASNAAQIVLSGTAKDGWIISPNITPAACTKLTYTLALTANGATTPALLRSTDEYKVMVSSDCGATWTAVSSFNSSSIISNTGQSETVDLAAYAGVPINVAFYAVTTSATATGAVQVHIDNVSIKDQAPVDLSAQLLVAPSVAGCVGGAAVPVTVRIRNVGCNPITFTSGVPATVTTTVGLPGGGTNVLTGTVTSGTLAVNGTLDVTMSATQAMLTGGTYTFTSVVAITGDGDATNDQNVTTRVVLSNVSLPQTLDFSSFTGSDLTTFYPNWAEASGQPLPSTAGSSWLSTSGFGGGANVTARINLYSNLKREWIVGPKFSASACSSISFDAGITDFADVSLADPSGMTGTDDSVNVMVSTDCGSTWTRIYSFNASNQPIFALNNYQVSLAAYSGQDIIVAFFATEGSIDNSPDYDFHLDNINISNKIPIDASITAVTAPASSLCGTASENVIVTLKNVGCNSLSSFPVTVNVTGAVTTSISGTYTGTIAPDATASFTVGTLDMTSGGTYNFSATVNTAGDGNASNNTATRTSITLNPSISITPASATICNGGSQALTSTVAPVNASDSIRPFGSSSTTANSTGSALGPNTMQDYYGGSRFQMLFKPAELTAAGLDATSSITSITNYLSAVDNTYALLNLKIKLKQVAAAYTLTSTFESGLTQVYNNASYTPSIGANAFSITPFAWDGTSALIVEFTYGNANNGNPVTATNTMVYGTTSFVSSSLYRTDVSTAATIEAITTAGYTYSSRPNTKFGYTKTLVPTWTVSPSLYSDAGTTTAYTGTPLATVYAKPSATTSYVATVSNSGCSSSASRSVTVNPRPTAVMSGTANICTGYSTNLSVALTGSGPWSITYTDGVTPVTVTATSSPKLISVSPTTTKTYTVSALSDALCSAISGDLTGSATVTPGTTCTLTWNGTTSNDWSDPLNWTPNGLPNSCASSVSIPSGTPNSPIVASAINIGDMTIQNGAQLTLNNTLSLCGNLTGGSSSNALIIGTSELRFIGTGAQQITGKVNANKVRVNNTSTGVTVVAAGDLSVNTALILEKGNFANSGVVTLKSNASTTAYLDNFTSTTPGTYSGPLTVERYVSNTANGYRDISSPVTATVGGLSDDFSIFGANGVQCWYAYNPYPNVQIYNEKLTIATGVYDEGFVSYTGLTNPLTAMLGVAVRTYNGAPYTIDLTGTPNTGAKSIYINKSTTATPTADGWNLIGNPYPSPITWSSLKALNAGKTDGSYYVFHTTGEYTGNWGSHNGVTGVNGATNEIASTQGFFVKATAGGAFNATNSVRVANENTVFYKTDAVQPDEIRLLLSNNVNSDEVVAYSDPNATMNYDAGIDALKMSGGSTVYMSYKHAGQEMAINAVDAVTVQTEFPLVLWAKETGTYTLSATELNLTGLVAYLKDATTNTLTDLRSNTAAIELTGGVASEGRYSVVFEEVQNPTGIANVKESNIQIYATEGKVIVQRSSNSNANITITNLLGQTVVETTSETNRTIIPVDNTNPWYAVVRVQEAGKVKVSKVLIR
ncbi:MAG: fibronectin type III domain-containing protein [Chitinophagales bacterium]|nr:fibronectin type III domain-containing protein [Chitinophagales bacterium]